MSRAIIVACVILVLAVVGGVAYVQFIYLPKMAAQNNTVAQLSPTSSIPVPTSPTTTHPAIQTSSTVSRVAPSTIPEKSSSTNAAATGVQGFGTTGWSSQSVVVSQSPLVCYTIQYPPQLTPQIEPLSSPPREYFADEAANRKNIANGLNGIEIIPLADTNAETVYKGGLLYTSGTSKITDFSTIGGLTGKEFLTPPISGLEPQGKWTIYLDLSEAGKNFALIISTPGTNTYDKTTGEAMARSIQPSCANH
jgi:hypothetical protein